MRLRSLSPRPGRMSTAGRWRVLVPVVCLVAGVGFAASARDSNGTDLRSPGVTSLAGTVHRAESRVKDADLQVRSLQAQVNDLTTEAGRRDSAVASTQKRTSTLREPAGLSALTGPGVEVVLDDAPADTTDVQGDDAADANQKVVHQSDLQAVVNSLWSGGAEAMSVAGQRIIPTSAVRCVGNTLLLNGEVYSPPFRVAAIGPSRTMQDRLDASPGVTLFKEAASYYGLGYTVESTDSLRIPAYTGAVSLTYATAGR